MAGPLALESRPNSAEPEHPVICLVGPTATGKTELALQIAQACGGEIISVDSALVYRHMDIGTAKPTLAERSRVTHHLIDICEPTTRYSVGEFVEHAQGAIADTLSRGAVPVLAGGTMLYFKSLWQGIAHLPAANPEIRQAIDEEAKARGWPSLHGDLARIDPVTASRIAATDRQRIQRALEVHRIAGRPLSQLIAESKAHTPAFDYWRVGLVPSDRSALATRIEQRLEHMLINGFMDEIKRLYKYPGLTAEHPSMRAVGYRQLWQVVAGNATLAAARNQILVATRQLAKRQLTWMRRFDLDEVFDPQSDRVAEEVLRRLRSGGGS